MTSSSLLTINYNNNNFSNIPGRGGIPKGGETTEEQDEHRLFTVFEQLIMEYINVFQRNPTTSDQVTMWAFLVNLGALYVVLDDKSTVKSLDRLSEVLSAPQSEESRSLAALPALLSQGRRSSVRLWLGRLRSLLQDPSKDLTSVELSFFHPNVGNLSEQ